MGCFSFLCKECGQPINSSSFRGERCMLFLLVEGLVVESMEGEYDSYGRVFDEEGESIKWGVDWSNVCELMFDKDKSNGIVAIHEDCFKGKIPMERSEDDPDQGWGDFIEPATPFKKG